MAPDEAVPPRDARGRFVSEEVAADEAWQARRRREVARRERARKQQRRRTRRRRLRDRWALPAALGFFVVAAAVAVGTIGEGEESAEGIGILLLCAGFVVSGIGPLVLISCGVARESLSVGVQALVFGGVLLGLLLWVAAPIAMLAAGAGWTDRLGATGRAIPLWMLAVITWGVFAAAVWGVVRALVEAHRARRR